MWLSRFWGTGMVQREIANIFRNMNISGQIGAGLGYFLLARLGLALALIHPSISAVWPATGLAIAVALVYGVQVGPVIFIASFLANVTATAPIAPSLAIAAGDTLEPLVAAYLLTRWSDGAGSFDSPRSITTFAVVCALAATPISASIGVVALWASGSLASDTVSLAWITWWLANLAGAVIVTPAIILWTRNPPERRELPMLLGLLLLTSCVGLLAFDPALSHGGRFAFLALVPLLWTALGSNPRNTAAVTVVLTGFAVMGTLATLSATSARPDDALLLYTIAFVVSAALPSLALSAEVTRRRIAEERLRTAYERLEHAVERRTAELVKSNTELQAVIEQSKTLAQENEQKQIQLVETQRLANLGSWSWDLESGAVTWSPQLFEIYGIRFDEFDGSFDAFLSRVHPDDRDKVARTIQDAVEKGTSFVSEERIIHPDGKIRHLASSGEVIKDAKGRVVGMLGICHDITAEKNADAALRESEESIRRLINGIRDYAIFMLDPNGRIVSWNAGAARIKGYEREEVLGKHVSIFYTPEDKSGGLAETALRTAAEKGLYEGEGWRVRRDGSRFWANVVIDAIHDRNGTLIGYGKITRDVTEKREAQLALEQTRDQLAQAQKMETIGQVTGGVAHDFNNLLAALLSSLRLLEKRLPAEPQSHRLLENAVSAAERGAALTQRLLSFARRQDLKPEIVDISKLIVGMTELLRRSIGPTIAIEIRCDAVATARVDPTQLELAIFNLALNARDAMPSGGTLVLETENEIVTQATATLELPPGPYVRVTVRDNGSGMDADTLRRAAEPFFTTKGIGKGTGLGLSMVHGLSAQSGGSMRMESEPGKGTVVTLWLPATDKPLPLARPQQAEPSPPSVKGCHVLVVDDDPLVSMGTVAMLEDLGHSAVEASSGRQALKVLEANPIDVVITDQAMPGMTGIELIAKIREARPTMPIILATGWAEIPGEEMREFLRLSKPYTQDELANAIRRLLATNPRTPPSSSADLPDPGTSR